MMKSTTFFTLLSVALGANAATCPRRSNASVYAQCGGTGFSGSTTCESGNTCVYMNEWYSQCLPDSQVPTTAKTTATPAPTSTLKTSTAGITSTSKVASTAKPTTFSSTKTSSTVKPTTTSVMVSTAPTSSTAKTTSTSTSTKPTTTSATSTKAATTSKTSTSAAPAATASSVSSNYTPASGMLPLYQQQTGIATFYGGNWDGGMCSFSGYDHGSLPGIALGAAQWFGAAGCGACIEVTGKAGSITVMVADQCPECAAGHLDLDPTSAQAVDGSGYATDGIFDITWDFVPCPVSGNIQLKNKDGTSQYYFAMQVRNSRLPIDKLEVSVDNGSTWTNVNREAYNYFTLTSGFPGHDTVSVRITTTTGEQITQTGVSVASGTVIQGNAQF